MLLILAGVSISLIVDNNGIIKRSKDARKQYGEAQTNEQADLENISSWIEDQVNGNKENPKPIKVKEGEKATSNGTINGEEGNSNNPTIPEGYIPINTDTSNWGDGTSAPTQDSVDHGLVIRDNSNNEWVWIPVPDVAVMCNTANTTEYTLCGTEGETEVKTNLYSSTITIGKDDNTKALTRTEPGTTSYREPDLVVGSDGASYDAKEEYYKTILGFDSKEEMAETFVSDYNEMIESIKTYGGFYIGRYELSEAGVQKNQPTLTYTNWYNLYAKCKSLNASKKVETRMIWGCQWDATCNFIANKGDKKDIVDSSSWGNYRNSTGDAAVKVIENGTEKYGSKQNTGYSEYWKANNIYDLAGNCLEWTQEAENNYCRAYRGGFYNGYNNLQSSALIYSELYIPGNGITYHEGKVPTVSGFDFRRYTSYFNNKVG